MFLIILTLLSALSISVTAAYFSIFGLAHLFAAAFIPVVIMASVVELGKIVGTSWLYQTWEVSSKLMKGWLMLLVFLTMLVTSLGVYGFLSKGFIDVQAPIDQKQLELTVVTEELDAVKERIEFIDDEIANYRLELKDLQAQIDNYPENYATKRIQAYKEQLPRRKEINQALSDLRKDKAKEMQLIKKINGEKAVVKSDVLNVEGDIGPIKYVAATLGIPKEQAVRAMILLLIVIFDPLAITLILAANISISNYLGKKGAGIGDLIKNIPPPTMVEDPYIRIKNDHTPLEDFDISEEIDVSPNVETSKINEQEILPNIPIRGGDDAKIIKYIDAINTPAVKGDIDKNLF